MEREHKTLPDFNRESSPSTESDSDRSSISSDNSIDTSSSSSTSNSQQQKQQPPAQIGSVVEEGEEEEEAWFYCTNCGKICSTKQEQKPKQQPQLQSEATEPETPVSRKANFLIRKGAVANPSTTSKPTTSTTVKSGRITRKKSKQVKLLLD